MKLYLDIESRSHVDLRKTGAYVYAEHPTTEIILFCWAVDNDPVSTWQPLSEPMPFELGLYLADPDVKLIAHNASFERTMLSGPPGQRIGVPHHLRDIARWDCTAARAAATGLPRTLDGAGHALGLDTQKDHEGHRLMLRMCKPLPANQQRGGTRLYLDTPESMARLAAYCARDVEVEREIDRVLPPLSATERQVWELTERMNDRGVLVDDRLISAVSGLVERAEIQVNADLTTATNGQVRRVTDHGAITRWLQSQAAEDTDSAGRDLGTDGVGKAALAAMLERTDLPGLVRSVLTMRQENGRSSAAKYTAILNRMSADRRIRGVMVYCGAASTGRWSSRGAQLHNLPRPFLLKKLAKVESALADLYAGASLPEFESRYGPAMVVASELLRPAFIAAPGSQLARGDSKQIEARVLPWLAGAEWKLGAFRRFDANTGPDLYKLAAGGIYHVPPETIGDEDPRRQIGKVSELALGFQGGARALQAMAKGYGVKIPHYEHPEGVSFDQREPAPDGSDEWIKESWRAANPEIVQFWRGIDSAAVECMSSAPGRNVPVGDHLSFRRNHAVLSLRLPSGRRLIYWKPELIGTRTPWGARRSVVRFWAEDAQTKRWAPFVSYGGLWTENAVQATARDLMAWWLLRGVADGLEPVLSVHDEGVFETDHPDGAALVERIMKQQPEWSAGLPVSADSSAGPRYTK